MTFVSVGGIEEFRNRGAELLKLDDRRIVLDMRKELRAHAKPVGDAVNKAIADVMPRRGGLSDLVARTGRTSLLTDLQRGVRLSLANRRGMRMAAFEAGRLRHPVWGNRKAWARQSVPSGAGEREFAQHADQLAMQVNKTVSATVERHVR